MPPDRLNLKSYSNYLSSFISGVEHAAVLVHLRHHSIREEQPKTHFQRHKRPVLAAGAVALAQTSNLLRYVWHYLLHQYHFIH